MNAVKIINYLESIFPLNLQMSWDKCGIQVGDCNQQVTSIMVALNADIESLQKAIDQNCQMLVTHHQFLLEEIMNLGKEVEIKTIAICGGSGADDLEQLAGRVDAYITGDSKHRHAKYALDHDIVLIDVPHHLEVIMEKRLASLLSNLGITVKEANSQDYYSYY